MIKTINAVEIRYPIGQTDAQYLAEELAARLDELVSDAPNPFSGEVVADWIAGLDSGSLDTWLSWLGLPTVVIDAIKAVLAQNVIAIQTRCAPRSAWRSISPMCTGMRSLLRLSPIFM